MHYKHLAMTREEPGRRRSEGVVYFKLADMMFVTSSPDLPPLTARSSVLTASLSLDEVPQFCRSSWSCAAAEIGDMQSAPPIPYP